MSQTERDVAIDCNMWIDDTISRAQGRSDAFQRCASASYPLCCPDS